MLSLLHPAVSPEAFAALAEQLPPDESFQHVAFDDFLAVFRAASPEEIAHALRALVNAKPRLEEAFRGPPEGRHRLEGA